ncbi:UDP-2,4-diacetamido-2,4,6-trideoxy-beta-L-altropyranose hydrolase [Marinobacterium zhoushanense]|uniref:UDP-2,4-diacetamido-2,4, 6-trideoxy-beta-L-altropyranose hydrolase n=1 Tax=Marinobacterium zhoushanense TaxID=1679163 RepID=A0ABQ1KTK4_9GAMM|nr:UDP-2,4-diacetamido-2,4,6-trideoxy-beta-L-altropyranose hydrolase [Marinobacterium zhoushanense]GGC07627.1 UDP-2,4-diacetamido-2,4,6-trideoxy-beta-L-altropyranose hydrolase [Marinobacterium zhoushanense]
MKFVFRVDASIKMGGGHWLRCLALADTLLAKGHQVSFVYAESIPALLKRVEQRPIALFELSASRATELDARLTGELVRRESADWLILDGYHFDSSYRQVLSLSSGVRLLLIDDLNDSGPLYADAVLNSTIYAEELSYSVSGNAFDSPCDLLLGPKYVLLPQAYYRVSVSGMAQRRYLFVNFGATDAAGLTLSALKILNELGFRRDVCVVTGPAMKQHLDVSSLCRRYGYTHLHDLPDLSNVLAQSRLALTAAGSTLHELAFMGVPAVFLVVSDNQLRSARCHQARGWCNWYDGRDAGGLRRAVTEIINWWNDEDELYKRATQACSLIDGHGAERVAEYLQQSR